MLKFYKFELRNMKFSSLLLIMVLIHYVFLVLEIQKEMIYIPKSLSDHNIEG